MAIADVVAQLKNSTDPLVMNKSFEEAAHEECLKHYEQILDLFIQNNIMHDVPLGMQIYVLTAILAKQVSQANNVTDAITVVGLELVRMSMSFARHDKKSENEEDE